MTEQDEIIWEAFESAQMMVEMGDALSILKEGFKQAGYLPVERQNLFVSGDFTLHSGEQSNWKAFCEVLSDSSWACIAKIVYERLKPFRRVVGVPTGGLKLAEALKPYCFPNPEHPTLIVDDVLTTGSSMEEARENINGETIGVVLFSRGVRPDWVTPVWQLWGLPVEKVEGEVLRLSVNLENPYHRDTAPYSGFNTGVDLFRKAILKTLEDWESVPHQSSM